MFAVVAFFLLDFFGCFFHRPAPGAGPEGAAFSPLVSAGAQRGCELVVFFGQAPCPRYQQAPPGRKADFLSGAQIQMVGGSFQAPKTLF